MWKSLKKNITVSQLQRYNVLYLKVNICISEILYNSSYPISGFLFMAPERSFSDESLLGALFFLALSSPSEESAGFLMAAQRVFWVHLSLRVF